MPDPSDALAKLDQAIARAGGAKVMLRMEEAEFIRAVLDTTSLPAGGISCSCCLANPGCRRRRAG